MIITLQIVIKMMEYYQLCRVHPHPFPTHPFGHQSKKFRPSLIANGCVVTVQIMITYNVFGRRMTHNIDDKSTSVQLMTWRHQATNHYLSQGSPRSMSLYGDTRPLRVRYRKGNTTNISFLFREIEKVMGWTVFSSKTMIVYTCLHWYVYKILRIDTQRSRP